MINRLINMAKIGMFDTAFLIASKYNLDEQLYNILKKNYTISFETLKELVNCKIKEDYYYLDICYNIIELRIENQNIETLDLSCNQKLERLYCNDNMLTVLNLDNTNLKHLDCSYNYLTTLNLTKCIKLDCLYANMNHNLEEVIFHKEPYTYIVPTNTSVKFAF